MKGYRAGKAPNSSSRVKYALKFPGLPKGLKHKTKAQVKKAIAKYGDVAKHTLFL